MRLTRTHKISIFHVIYSKAVPTKYFPNCRIMDPSENPTLAESVAGAVVAWQSGGDPGEKS